LASGWGSIFIPLRLNMKYSIYIDNITAKEWGLNVQLAYLFDWVFNLPSWAESVHLENEVYYFASRSRASEELPLLSDKHDTVYRQYKSLEEFGLIILKKIDGKDCIRLTEKGSKWGRSLGKKSEHSEKNPSKLGKISENDSEKNPTYKNTINEKNTIDQRKQVFIQKLEPYIFTFGKEMVNNFSDHWTEHNENGYKMRFEAEKFFSLKKRLTTWKKISESRRFKEPINKGKIG